MRSCRSRSRVAQRLGRQRGAGGGERLLLLAPAALLALEVLVQRGAAALDLLAHLVEGGGDALDLRACRRWR